jgi:hypothetical protein
LVGKSSYFWWDKQGTMMTTLVSFTMTVPNSIGPTRSYPPRFQKHGPINVSMSPESTSPTRCEMFEPMFEPMGALPSTRPNKAVGSEQSCPPSGSGSMPPARSYRDREDHVLANLVLPPKTCLSFSTQNSFACLKDPSLVSSMFECSVFFYLHSSVCCSYTTLVQHPFFTSTRQDQTILSPI